MLKLDLLAQMEVLLQAGAMPIGYLAPWSSRRMGRKWTEGKPGRNEVYSPWWKQTLELEGEMKGYRRDQISVKILIISVNRNYTYFLKI